MTTAEKREHIEKDYPGLIDFLHSNLSAENYGTINEEYNKQKWQDDPIALQYVITLLCDELVSLTNENESED